MCKSNLGNILEIANKFKDKKSCLEFIANRRWKDTPTCPICGHQEVYKFKTRFIYKCKDCKKQFSPLKNTIFDNSKIPLQKWMIALYLHTSHKKGISSVQLSKDIGITQKSAWYVLGRIRNLILKGTMELDEKFEGHVEIDETYVGGKEKNKHQSKKTKGTQGRSTKTKTAVVGILERGGKIRAKKITKVDGENLLPIARENITTNSIIFTDEWRGYIQLKYHFEHQKVNHGAKQYVDGDAHVNTVEGFWSQFKRSIYGIYHSVSPKHLDFYINENTFRYNTRHMGCIQRMEYLLTMNNDKRLMYNELIAA